MKTSPSISRVLMNLYPPFLVNRVVVKYVSQDFRTVKVKIVKSIFNRNLQGSIFGGTIFSAADPFVALMYWQIFNQQNIFCEAWLKSAKIDYLKPAKTSLYLNFEIAQTDIEEARKNLVKNNKHECTHIVEMKDSSGVLCATMETTISLKLKHKKRQ